MSDNNSVGEFVPPYKTIKTGVIGFFSWILFIICGLGALADYAGFSETKSAFPVLAIIAAIGFCGIVLGFTQRPKQKKNRIALQKYLLDKENDRKRRIQEATDEITSQIHAIDGFSDCKMYFIDLWNAIAFSKSGSVAIYTDKIGAIKFFPANHITKITQEIKPGECFAHIFTEDFDDNVFDLRIGKAQDREDQERIKALYNEIKGMCQSLKKDSK